jgi:hypothetical protein
MFVAAGISKRCGRCRRDLPLDEFNRMGDGLQHWCRSCFRDYFRHRGDVHRHQSRAARRKRVAAARRFIAAFLAEHPCVDCGEADPRVLDFDHVGEKAALVSALAAWGAPPRRMEAEIAECEVRCANCHRRVTARRAGWTRLAGDVDDPRRRFAAPVRRNLNYVHGLLAKGRCVDCGGTTCSCSSSTTSAPSVARSARWSGAWASRRCVGRSRSARSAAATATGAPPRHGGSGRGGRL